VVHSRASLESKAPSSAWSPEMHTVSPCCVTARTLNVTRVVAMGERPAWLGRLVVFFFALRPTTRARPASTSSAMQEDLSESEEEGISVFARPTARPAASAAAKATPVSLAAVPQSSTCTSIATPAQSASKDAAAPAPASFDALGLDEWVVTNLARLNLFKPTPVQAHCIPPLLRGVRSVVACAPTGSGKTAAFALPILDALARDPFGIFALVLTPTRELAIQIGEQFEALGAPVRCRCQVIIGGLPIVPQQSALAKLPHVVVATPGRLMDHCSSASPPRLGRARFLVLDEADRLLERSAGFAKDFAVLARALGRSETRQVVLVSATLGGQELAVAAELGLLGEGGGEPEFAWRAETKAATVATLAQDLILVPADVKHAYFAWFLRRFGPRQVIEASKLGLVGKGSTSKKRCAHAGQAG
jgi:hypothetical protein